MESTARQEHEKKIWVASGSIFDSLLSVTAGSQQTIPQKFDKI
jgi:hypothetical protein